MAPPGTSFQRPPGIQSKPAPIDIDSDEEPDPPVHHSSDEETQGSNLKPTNFKKGGRGLDSTPNRGSDKIIKESPRPNLTIPPGFSDFMQGFKHNSSPPRAKPADDMASSYGSSMRRARPEAAPKQTAPSRAQTVNATAYNSLADIHDYELEAKVKKIQATLEYESVQRCMDALAKCKGNVGDATSWLLEDEEQDAPGEEDEADELASITPVAKRGVAIPKTSQYESSQPVRPAAKQELKVQTRTIAEKYSSTQAGRKFSLASPEDEVVKPRKRLQQGRKTRSPTPPSSPPPAVQKFPQPLQRLKNQKQKHVIAIADDDDSESDSGIGRDQSEEPEEAVAISHFNRRLLKFFNECSLQDLTDLSAQPQDVVALLIDQRPFVSLDSIRAVSNVTETKSGKKSKSRPIGDKIVDICSETWTGYDAVDELVEECERIAKPIQDALKGWGVGAVTDGELHLMNLDEAHDSGMGTPASSCPSDSPAPRTSKIKSKGRLLSQPESMNSEATLKDYQVVGLNWLNLLYLKGISCILADDMGLGKTCQIIAFLAHLQEQNVDGVHLVIVPGSTLENWLREFAYFAPQLRVVPYYGSKSERGALQDSIRDEFDTIDVVVTTYDMAVKPDDNKFLRKYIDPLVCVYDEAHALRNPKSDRYTQLTRINATFRVLLTGTPLQNNLQELVAILAFIMPKLFQEKREDLEYIFKHKASTKDADHAALLSTQRTARARSMMTPFILRRKKQQVLDLPTKHSRVEYCDMTATQANYYADLMDEAQQHFSDKAKGKKATAKASSNILMALRKAANHQLLARRIYDDKKVEKIASECHKQGEYPENTLDQVINYLVGDHYQSFKGGDFGLHVYCRDRAYLKRFTLKKKDWMDSGKIDIFRRLVSGFAANGDRALVFSQFTTMMDILEEVLKTLDIKFMRLDGDTKIQDRQAMLDQFADDESIPVFMLSTRAGGAGINLASANKVIIFDSGFNPQDDIQAENRAHRVGQTREVEVIRLVTRGTIEEQIHALGESKLALDERVAGEGATAAEEKQVEKMGEQMVENMLMGNLMKEKEIEDKESSSGPVAGLDLKDAFKSGLEGVGLKVASKQAQF